MLKTFYSKLKKTKSVSLAGSLLAALALVLAPLSYTTGVAHAASYTDNTWSGYVRNGSSGSYTDISSNWTVPAVTCAPTTTSSVAWIGLDGSAQGDNDHLIQAGTTSECVNGTLNYQMWWEIIPEEAYMHNVCAVTPGDDMYVRIHQVLGTTFRIIINNLTSPSGCGTFTEDFTYNGALASAEWIVERPWHSATEQLDLADFGTITFENATLNGANPGLTYANDSMNLTSNGFQNGTILAMPSFPNSTYDGFSTTYCDPVIGCRALNVSPNDGTKAEIHSMTNNGSEVWAAGWEYPPSTSRRPLAYKYNGSGWTKYSLPPASSGHHNLYGIAAGNSGELWAVGKYTASRNLTLAYRWDGTSWAKVSSDNPSGTSGSNVSNELTDVAIDGSGTAWAVGTWWKATSPGGNQPLLEKWDGTRFAHQPLTLPAGYNSAKLKAIDFNSATNGWAVGPGIIYHYDGTSWTPSVPSGTVSLEGVSAVSDTEAWAVGAKSLSSTTWVPVVLRYDGTSWSEQTTNIQWPTGENLLTAVDAASPSDIWAVGYAATTSTTVPVMVHYDGANWTKFDVQSPGAYSVRLDSITNKFGSVWAGGTSRTSTALTLSNPYIVMY